MTDTPAVTSPPAAPARHGGSIPDMARSLLLIVVVLFAVGGTIMFGHHGQPAVHVVDPQPAINEARASQLFPVLVPRGLPSGWRVTSARDRYAAGALHFHLGYLTPGGQYAGLEESNGDAAAFLARAEVVGPGAQPLASVSVGGVSWQRFRTSTGTALVSQGGPATVVVTGSAPEGDLEKLAAALH